MKTIHAVDVDHAWLDAVTEVLEQGIERNPRGLKCLASQRPVSIGISQPRRRILANPGRDAKRHFMAGEFAWILTGSDQLEQVKYYNSRMSQFSDDGMTLWGAYGPRVVSQLPDLIEKLKKDPDTRQAVLTLWRPNPPQTKDTPCTVSLIFKRVGRFLDLLVTMRSNDLWLGFPYDVFTFTLLQEVVATAVGADVGYYHHVVNDLHLYEEHLKKAQAALKYETCDSATLPLYLEGQPAELAESLRVFDLRLRNTTHAMGVELPIEPLAKALCVMMRERHLQKEVAR